MNQSIKESLMRLAIAEAENAIQEGNSPFGAVLSDHRGNVVDIAHNTTRTDCDPTAHAEINLIRKVAKKQNSRNLVEYCLISNAQSCPMCFSAAIKAKITHFIYGYGEDETLLPQIDVLELAQRCPSPPKIETGILKEECRLQLERARLQS
jgi:tRNA(adenine34) deaminase